MGRAHLRGPGHARELCKGLRAPPAVRAPPDRPCRPLRLRGRTGWAVGRQEGGAHCARPTPTSTLVPRGGGEPLLSGPRSPVGTGAPCSGPLLSQPGPGCVLLPSRQSQRRTVMPTASRGHGALYSPAGAPLKEGAPSSRRACLPGQPRSQVTASAGPCDSSGVSHSCGMCLLPGWPTWSGRCLLLKPPRVSGRRSRPRAAAPGGPSAPAGAALARPSAGSVRAVPLGRLRGRG